MFKSEKNILLRQIEFVEVISSKCSATLGALAQSRVIATANTLGAEDVETLGENCVFLPGATAGAVELHLQPPTDAPTHKASMTTPPCKSLSLQGALRQRKTPTPSTCTCPAFSSDWPPPPVTCDLLAQTPVVKPHPPPQLLSCSLPLLLCLSCLLPLSLSLPLLPGSCQLQALCCQDTLLCLHTNSATGHRGRVQLVTFFLRASIACCLRARSFSMAARVAS